MKFWNQYTKLVKRNFDINHTGVSDIGYWRNLLFANAIIYLIPLSMIALIPALVFSWLNNLMIIVVVDLVSLILILLIGFSPNLSHRLRKLFFVICTYSVATATLYLIGPVGPGLIYMFAATIFCIIIFSNEYSYHPSHLNLLICIIIGFLIPFNVLPWAEQEVHSVTEWIVISTNLIFLSYLSSALLPKVFIAFHQSIQKEKETRLIVDQQKKELEGTLAELKRKNKDLEMFAYTSSHDLQEPLRMVTSFLTKLENRYGDKLDERAHQYIFYAVDGAKRMRQVIMDLLEFSRADKLDGEKEEVELNVLIDEISLLHRRDIKKKSVIIQKVNLPTIRHHRTALYQVFQNLISNAIKYSSPNRPPEIIVSAEESAEYWTFSVQDNGIGIDEEYYDKIFLIFQRLHNREEYSGTGMGLAIVKKIVENLGGTIWVEPNNGKGTSFYFTLINQKAM